MRAAEAALSRQQYVSAIDVLCGTGLLAPTNVDSWRKGRIDVLEQSIQGSPRKISEVLALFRDWAHQKALHPSETAYVRITRAGTTPLRFTHIGDPETENTYRTHYLSTALSEPKRRQTGRQAQPGAATSRIRDSARFPVCGMRNNRRTRLFPLDGGGPALVPRLCGLG